VVLTAKPLFWVGSSLHDLRRFPKEVREGAGFALYLAQMGDKHFLVKPLKGFRSAGILEVISDFDGNAYRTIYTVRFRDAVYVLHVFQKKSKKGIQTPKKEIDLIRERLRQAEEHYTEWSERHDEQNT
jgi:phage-related protein